MGSPRPQSLPRSPGAFEIVAPNPPFPWRPAGARAGPLCPNQSHRQPLRAVGANYPHLRRQLVAGLDQLWRKQPHPHGAVTRQPTARTAAAGWGRQPLPYLLQAAVLAAGLDGIERQLDPGPRSERNTAAESRLRAAIGGPCPAAWGRPWGNRSARPTWPWPPAATRRWCHETWLGPTGAGPRGLANFRFSSQKVRSAEQGGGGRTDQIGPYGN